MATISCPDCGTRNDVEPASSESRAVCRRCGLALLIDERVVSHDDSDDAARSGGTLLLTSPPARPAPASASPDLQELAFLSPPRSPNEIGWLDHYRVVRMLGKGGMGMVFQAEDTHLRRWVALKVMRPEMAHSSSSRQRFLREARAMASVKSDHIVTIYQVAEHQGIPFLAMEFMTGMTLDEWLRPGVPPPMEQVLSIGIQVARGLEDAHACGLIHRDIKPGNIFLETTGGGDSHKARSEDANGPPPPKNAAPEPTTQTTRGIRAKILDFGLARAASEDIRITQTGTVVGTPAYMAPEQAEGHRVDSRTDLFSFGCVLYQLATGEMAFSGSTTISVLKKIVLSDPRPPLEINPQMTKPLASLVSWLLQKKPENRPPSATAVLEALQKMAADPAMPATAILPPGSRLRAWGATRPSRKRRKLLIACAAALVALALFGFLLSRTLPHRSQEARKVSRATARGVTDDKILLGMSGAFSGQAKELGRQMKLGIDTFFSTVNEQGGVEGRRIELVALDDGYEPDRALANLKELHEIRKVFALIGSVGTPTTERVLPYVLEKNIPFFGPFTGAHFLRKDPPDRYVFNYRASYAEETAAAVRYLVEIVKLQPEAFAVFMQQDSYGDSGLEGVVKAVKEHGGDPDRIIRTGYARNSTDVDEAVRVLSQQKNLRAVIMVATYRPAARLIQRMRDEGFDGIFTSVSFVDSDALSEELRDIGPGYAGGIAVTQVVPPVNSAATAVTRYKALLRKYFPSEEPGFTSLEGFLAAEIFTEGLRRAGESLTPESLVDALESIRNLDIGHGARIRYGPSEHQASHKVWVTVLDETGGFRVINNLD